MENDKIISKFLSKYSQYNLNDYLIECRESNRYDGDWEIVVWERFYEGDPLEYVGRWWCKQTNDMNNNVCFEKEEIVREIWCRLK